MELTKLGWNAELNQQFAPQHAKGLVPARVAVEDKHFFRVWTTDGELLAQVSGKCIHEARWSNSKLPKVGDWVAVKLVPNEEKAVIQAILPRRTQLSRKMTGHGATEQILATNIDTAFLVTAADMSFDDALYARDIYLVAGCVAVVAGVLSAGMLLGDVLLALSDPRVPDVR
jgi:ribosome biogenesis GTPase